MKRVRRGTAESPTLCAVITWRRTRERPKNYRPPGTVPELEPGFVVPDEELCELVFV